MTEEKPVVIGGLSSYELAVRRIDWNSGRLVRENNKTSMNDLIIANPIAKDVDKRNDNVPVRVVDQYGATPGHYFTPFLKINRPDGQKKPAVEMRFEEEELADIGAVLLRAIEKGRKPSSRSDFLEASRVHNAISKKDIEDFHSAQNTDEDSQIIFSTVSITGAALGCVMVLLFVGLLFVSSVSGVHLVHPVIAIAFVISGITFIGMDRLGRE